MKSETIVINSTGDVGNDINALLNGTHLVGSIRADYQKLINTFGESNSIGDEYKIDAEWIILTPSGIATLYNWKDGKNYCGDEGLELEYITEWHIGGRDTDVIDHIKEALSINIDLPF